MGGHPEGLECIFLNPECFILVEGGILPKASLMLRFWLFPKDATRKQNQYCLVVL